MALDEVRYIDSDENLYSYIPPLVKEMVGFLFIILISMDTQESHTNGGKCPFQKVNSRFQRMTKGSIAKAIGNRQKEKHAGYVEILRRAFQANEQYFTNISTHIIPEDVSGFQNIKNDRTKRIIFLNTKLKECFWNGFSFSDNDNLTSAELSFKTIGNLGLEDVTMIVDEFLSKSGETIIDDEMLGKIWEEIHIRLKNNVLIDSILHLPDFPDKLITLNKETSAQIVSGMIEDSRVQKDDTVRFSPNLVAEEFREPMTADGMIDAGGIVPQLTFGCPIINLDSGNIFRTFVTEFIRHFFVTDRE